MSIYTDRAMISLHNMVCEMYKKNIDLSRIIKCSVQLLQSGLTPNSIPNDILMECIDMQRDDGGWTAVADTIWNTKFLSYYPDTKNQRVRALAYLKNNKVEYGYGRSARDIGRIPVTGLAFYFLPELADLEGLYWLELLWEKEKNSLTYKAAYTLMSFKKNSYLPSNNELIHQTIEWLIYQQEKDGGFAPWKSHPVGTDIYCTAVSCIGLLQYVKEFPNIESSIIKAYDYMRSTQMKNGIWRYHELEDGGGWGLVAMTLFEQWRDEREI